LQRVILALLALLLLITPLVHDQRVYRPFRTPKELLSLAGGALIIGLHLLGRRWARPSLRRWRGVPGLPLVLLALWATAGAFIWGRAGLSGPTWLLAVVHLGMVWVIAERVRRPGEARLLLGAYLLAMVVSGAYATVQYYGFDPWFTPLRDYYRGRWLAGAWIGQPTLLGGALGPAIPIALCWLLLSQGLGRKVLSALGLLIMLLGVLATHTRAVFLGLLAFVPFQVGALVFSARGVLVRRRRILFSLLLGMFIVLLPFVTRNPSFTGKLARTRELRRDSVGARLFYWRVLAQMALDHPVRGVGLGVFAPEYFDYQARVLEQGTSLRAYMWERVQHAHNEMLQLIAELGLVGGFLFFWALAAMGAVGWRAVRGAAAEEDRLMVIGLLAAAGVLLTDALFSLPFHIVPSAQLGVLLAGLLLSRWVRELPGGAGDRAAGGEG
jgi:O-antigen ligase